MSTWQAAAFVIAFIAFIIGLVALGVFAEMHNAEQMRICVENGGSWSNSFGGSCAMGEK